MDLEGGKVCSVYFDPGHIVAHFVYFKVVVKAGSIGVTQNVDDLFVIANSIINNTFKEHKK